MSGNDLKSSGGTNNVVLESEQVQTTVLDSTTISQTSVESPNVSVILSEVDHFLHESGTSEKLSSIETQTIESSYQICEKHMQNHKENAATNPVTMSSSLCQNCSKSMLSYIMIVQNFLNGLAQDISRQVDPIASCLECVKESLHLPLQPLTFVALDRDSSSVDGSNITRTRDSFFVQTIPESQHSNRNHQGELCGSSESSRSEDTTIQSSSQHQLNVETLQATYSTSRQSSESHQSQTGNRCQQVHPSKKDHWTEKKGSDIETEVLRKIHENISSQSVTDNEEAANEQFPQPHQREVIIKSNENNIMENIPNQNVGLKDIVSSNNHRDLLQSVDGSNWQENLYPVNENVDGIISSLFKLEHELASISEDETLWEKLANIQQIQGVGSKDRVVNEAFVTIARNNVEVIGCLVLGSSLLACGTSRTICVLVYDGVNECLMEPLSSVFHVVLHVRSLDSIGTTKLALLDQPELGIYLGKLNIWRLEQFTKCIYLNPDTVVVQNCDELFSYEELSAVPDVGWPDCFNSAMFVFKPSILTFCNLLKHAEERGSYDGGDQGLLNAYFQSWSQDISKKLSFIYNLMANVSYTYTPAFRQFGRNVKIVQFMGSFKPWHVKFYVSTSQIAPSSTVHPTFVQFINVWLNIFRICVLRLLSRKIQDYASNENIISACDVLKFFPTGLDFEVDYLSTLSVRSHPRSDRPILHLPLINPQSSSETVDTEIEKLQVTSPDELNFSVASSFLQEQEEQQKDCTGALLLCSDVGNVDNEELEDNEVFSVPPEHVIPGSDIGDYQGMSAWEQGRMDYEGRASSDNIIKRLHFMIGDSDTAR